MVPHLRGTALLEALLEVARRLHVDTHGTEHHREVVVVAVVHVLMRTDTREHRRARSQNQELPDGWELASSVVARAFNLTSEACRAI